MEFKIFKKYDIHQWFYSKLRSEFPDAGSQFVIRAIANVASAFSREKVLHRYRETGAMKLDHRMYSIKDNAVSVWTTTGRIWIPVKWTKKHLALKHKFGAAEIILDRPTGIYYIVFSYKPQTAPMIEVQWENMGWTIYRVICKECQHIVTNDEDIAGYPEKLKNLHQKLIASNSLPANIKASYRE